MTKATVLLGCVVIALTCQGLRAAGFQAATSTSTSVALTWTAPGDDKYSGQASAYDLRYSLTAITASNWAGATKVTGVPSPKTAGSPESYDVQGLSSNTSYYFALKAGDEIPNWSALSNVILKSTQKEAIPPSAIADLAAGARTTSSVTLIWTAPGDDGNIGTATAYDIRYSTAASAVSDWWTTATKVTGVPGPKVAGTSESFTVRGLSFSAKYYFAIKTSDEVPNWSGLSNEVIAIACGGICNGTPGNVDCSSDESVDISDLSTLIDYLYISSDPICICLGESNIDSDQDNTVDLADLSRLTDYLFISHAPLGPCR